MSDPINAALVTDKKLRTRFMDIIDAEFERTRSLLTEFFDGEMSERRPRMAETLDIREDPLKGLHQREIVLLRERCEQLAAGRQHEAITLIPALLLSINGIACGLRIAG